MVSFSIIQKSQLEGAHRLDAEYHQPEYLNTRKQILFLPHVTLGEISRKFKKGIFDIKADTYLEKGVPFIRISNLKNGLIDKTEIAYISPEANQREEATSLRRGDFVISKTAYPAASLITDDLVNISQDIIGISLKKEWQDRMLASFVVAFLNSKFGMVAMRQWFQGNIQMHLSLPDSKTIALPLLSIGEQGEVARLLEKSKEEVESGGLLFSQAEDLLLEELELKNVKFGEDLAYIVRFSDIETAERMDADYFQPKYKKLIEVLRKYGAKELSKVVENISAKFDPEKKPQDMFKYVELSNINASPGIIDGYSEVLGKEAPGRAKRVLKAGDVIVSGIEGSLEKSALVDKEQDGFLASTGFFQFRTGEISPEVLLVLAKSIVFQWQLKQKTAGTILTAVPKESIKNVLIPILPELTQQKISDLVRQSHEARKKSKTLFESAKRKVEELIEKGGVQA